jgi:hypothetical protein
LSKYNVFRHLFVVLAATVLLAACQTSEQSAGLYDDTPPPPPPAVAPAPEAVYADFPEVKIPARLNINRNASFVYQSDSITGGVLTLTGAMSAQEVINWFQDQMPKEGWEPLSTFKYQKFILIYLKPGKVCLIEAQQSTIGGTSVEIWVAPTSQTGITSKIPGLRGTTSGPREESLSSN